MFLKYRFIPYLEILEDRLPPGRLPGFESASDDYISDRQLISRQELIRSGPTSKYK